MEWIGQAWDSFLAYLGTQPPGRIYLFLFLGSFMENVVPPIPGDSLIVFGAYLAGMRMISLWPAYVCMWAGSATGCMVVYALARWKGRDFFLRVEKRFFTESKLSVAEWWFARHGIKIVILNRFLPTVRAFVGIVAAISGLHPIAMAFYVLLGTLLWNSILVYFGLKVGENWQVVVAVLRTYNQVLLGAGLLALAAYYGWKWKKRRTAHGARSTGHGANP